MLFKSFQITEWHRDSSTISTQIKKDANTVETDLQAVGEGLTNHFDAIIFEAINDLGYNSESRIEAAKLVSNPKVGLELFGDSKGGDEFGTEEEAIQKAKEIVGGEM